MQKEVAPKGEKTLSMHLSIYIEVIPSQKCVLSSGQEKKGGSKAGQEGMLDIYMQHAGNCRKETVAIKQGEG